MSTQPVPTFPAVAGLEKFYGMTPDEVIQVLKVINPNATSITGEGYTLDSPNFAYTNNLDAYVSKYIDIFDPAYEFMKEVARISLDGSYEPWYRNACDVFLYYVSDFINGEDISWFSS